MCSVQYNANYGVIIRTYIAYKRDFFSPKQAAS